MYTQTVASLNFEVGIKEVEVHAWLAVQNTSDNHSSDNQYWRKVFFFFKLKQNRAFSLDGGHVGVPN